jgi:hypothetical protein
VVKFTFNPDGTDYSAVYLEMNTPEQMRYRVEVTDARIKSKYPNNYYFIFRKIGKRELEYQQQGMSDLNLLAALAKGIENALANKIKVAV